MAEVFADADTDPFAPQEFDKMIAPTIVLSVMILGLLVEFCAWLVCYRTSGYKKLTAEVEIIAKKVQALKETGAKEGDKRIKKLEETLKKATGQMFWFNARIMALNFCSMFIAYRVLVAHFKGKVAGKLPFVPFSLLHRMTHGGLSGDNYTECSGTFIYVLCQTGVRLNVTKFLGMGPSRAMAKSTSLQAMAEKQA
eukprot:gene8094-1337_t